jgi:hypothetical protein
MENAHRLFFRVFGDTLRTLVPLNGHIVVAKPVELGAIVSLLSSRPRPTDAKSSHWHVPGGLRAANSADQTFPINHLCPPASDPGSSRLLDSRGGSTDSAKLCGML